LHNGVATFGDIRKFIYFVRGDLMSNIERIQCGNGNAYLLSDGEDAVLVDTCRIQYKEKIVERCKKKNVRLIVLTHGHIDHIQNAAFFSKELNAPIAMHKADCGLITNNLAEPLSAHSILGKFILKLSQKSFEKDKAEPFAPGIMLQEGDSLQEDGVSATIIELPGHTKGSIGIKTGNSVIVGDALMNMFYPVKSPLYGDKAAMEKSAERISSFGDMTIYFGHGKPVKNKLW